MAKSWQARIGAAPDEAAEKFVESLSFDYRLAPYDIRGSKAHATMLARVGLISRQELRQIDAGLGAIAHDIEAGTFTFDRAQEDIHMAIEAALIARIGSAGKKLHTARSRNDQVALDLRLWCLDAIDTLDCDLTAAQTSLVRLAQRQGHIILPAYTHLQRAQPMVFGHELLAYAEMFQRDRERLADSRRRTAVSPLGAGAVAGTTLPIDRALTAELLRLPKVTANSLDAVSDRDFAAELAFGCALIAAHLSRWAEQWIIYSTTEFNFVRLADRHTTGSSMMPQKRNPDLLELIRGKTGGVYGHLLALLTILKGQPLAYNRDMQEDKRSLFAAVDTVHDALGVAAAMINAVTIQPEAIRQHIDEGFLDATALAEYLVRRGVPFRSAHQAVGRLVAQCESAGIHTLAALPLETLRRACPQIAPDVYRVLGAESTAAAYRSAGAGGTDQLKNQLASWIKRLNLNNPDGNRAIRGRSRSPKKATRQSPARPLVAEVGDSTRRAGRAVPNRVAARGPPQGRG